MCWFGSSPGTGVAITLALQEGLGLSPLAAGLCLVPSALAALPLVLAAGRLVAGAAGGLITAPNQGLTLALAPAGAHGLAAGFFPISPRISSTICIAASTGLVVAVAGPAGHRTGLATAPGLALALTAVALLASALNRRQPLAAPTEVP